jgi:hypothetical protein
MERWEYLTLVWAKRRTVAERMVPVEVPRYHPSYPFAEEKQTFPTYTEITHIWRPGAGHPEEILGPSEQEDAADGMGSDVLVLLNKLGREGWELVDRTIQSSAVHKGVLGWSTAGTPVEIVWTMKRMIGAEADGRQ